MKWTRTETLALAFPPCAHCHGLGLRGGRRGDGIPCNCVLRGIFRACYEKFVYCAGHEKEMCRASLEANPGRARHYNWGWKDEEFVADFCLVSRRALDDFEYRIFNYHYLLGADWKLCCRQLNMPRGIFFHHIYRIQQKLGRIYRELRPYALYPIDEYFNGGRAQEVTSSKVVAIRRPRAIPAHLQFPAAKSA
jgi:hypothetical protein